VSEITINLLTKNEVVEIIRCLGYQAIPKDDDDYGELIFCSYEGVSRLRSTYLPFLL
jgi:hypothetical protein